MVESCIGGFLADQTTLSRRWLACSVGYSHPFVNNKIWRLFQSRDKLREGERSFDARLNIAGSEIICTEFEKVEETVKMARLTAVSCLKEGIDELEVEKITYHNC